MLTFVLSVSNKKKANKTVCFQSVIRQNEAFNTGYVSVACRRSKDKSLHSISPEAGTSGGKVGGIPTTPHSQFKMASPFYQH